MKFRFSKMHGIGNDYVYVNGFKENISNPNEAALKVSDRHIGVGSDGLIIILPSEEADCKMAMYNADGSEGMMCGNGVRCVGKYMYDHKLTDKTEITVETKSGIKKLSLTIENEKVTFVTVDMGMAILNPREIPVLSEEDTFIRQAISVEDQSYTVTCVSMGNPHAVIFMEGIESLDLEKLGPPFENHRLFPDRINTEFVEIIDKHTLKMRVWERGSGETYACGTGACAVVVAAVLNGYCKVNEEVTVILLGGSLFVTYLEDGRVLMNGSATHVFDGEIEI